MSTTDSEEPFEVAVAEGVVSVWHGRSARDVEETDRILAAIDEALSHTGLQLLLFDSRDADRTPDVVQERIWSWLSAHTGLRKVATVMHSTSLAKNVRVTGVGKGIRIRTFDDIAKARKWLIDLEA